MGDLVSCIGHHCHIELTYLSCVFVNWEELIAQGKVFISLQSTLIKH